MRDCPTTFHWWQATSATPPGQLTKVDLETGTIIVAQAQKQLTLNAATDAAQRDVESVVQQVCSDLKHNEELRQYTISAVYHYVVSGTHVDPDEGRDYVPVNEPLNSSRRRKIAKRNQKVQTLVDWLQASLQSGTAPEEVQAGLEQRQPYPVVGLCLSEAELAQWLTNAYHQDEILPGCLDGGYFDLLGNETILYGWTEGLPCEGGVTDRFGAADLST